MQVSFWSNYHQIGTTCNMIATAMLIALKFRVRILMAHNHFDKSALESAFMDKSYIKHGLMDFSDTGIDALSRFIRFNKLEKDGISSYTTTILKNRLDLLIGTRNTNKDIYHSNLNETIQLILKSASRFYDLVFIDTTPGKNKISLKIIENSDLIVINLSQNLSIIEDFMSNFEDYKDKALILIGKYDSNSRYNIKRLKRHFGFAQAQVIPYNIGFTDACVESRVVDFFIKNLQNDKNDIHYNFINRVTETAETIINMLGIDITQKRVSGEE